MLPSGFPAHIPPPSFDPCWPGFRFIRRRRSDSVSSLPASRASPVSADEKSSCFWMFCRLSFLRFVTYLPLLLVRAFVPVPGSAYLLLRLSASECLTSLADVRPTMPSADFCPAVRSPRDTSVPTHSRSPEVSSAAFRAQSPDLRFACLMDMDFAVSCPLVPRSRLISGFCSSTRAFAPRFLQTPPRGGSPCASLILHLHQVG